MDRGYSSLFVIVSLKEIIVNGTVFNNRISILSSAFKYIVWLVLDIHRVR